MIKYLFYYYLFLFFIYLFIYFQYYKSISKSIFSFLLNAYIVFTRENCIYEAFPTSMHNYFAQKIILSYHFYTKSEPPVKSELLRELKKPLRFMIKYFFNYLFIFNIIKIFPNQYPHFCSKHILCVLVGIAC